MVIGPPLVGLAAAAALALLALAACSSATPTLPPQPPTPTPLSLTADATMRPRRVPHESNPSARAGATGRLLYL